MNPSQSTPNLFDSVGTPPFARISKEKEPNTVFTQFSSGDLNFSFKDRQKATSSTFRETIGFAETKNPSFLNSSQRAALLESKDASKEAYENLRKDNLLMKEEINRLSKIVEAQKIELSKAQDRAVDSFSEQERQKLEQKVKDLNAVLSDFNRKKIEETSQVSFLTTAIKDRDALVEQYKSKWDEVTKENAVLKEKLFESNQIPIEYQLNKIVEDSPLVLTLRSQIEDLSKENLEIRRDNDNLQTQLKNLVRNMNSEQSQLKSLAGITPKTIQNLIVKNVVSEIEIKRLQKRIKHLKSEHHDQDSVILNDVELKLSNKNLVNEIIQNPNQYTQSQITYSDSQNKKDSIVREFNFDNSRPGSLKSS